MTHPTQKAFLMKEEGGPRHETSGTHEVYLTASQGPLMGEPLKANSLMILTLVPAESDQIVADRLKVNGLRSPVHNASFSLRESASPLQGPDSEFKAVAYRVSALAITAP